MIAIPFEEVGRALHRVWYYIPMGLVGLLSWAVWAVRWSISRRYRPLVNDHRESTSVVVPSYREDPDVLMRCLESWLAEAPGEIIVVVDVEDRECLRRLVEHPDDRVRPIAFRHRGKRSALGVGIRAAQNDIIVLTDSDTNWETGLLAAVQMPFVDPEVGGVSTRQNAHARETSRWRVVADWLVNIRYLDYVPAQGMAGGVACLSGRTAAYRRTVVLPVLGDLEHESFLGRECNAGDDGRLTWLVLSTGYRTVYQSSARAWSMFPCTFRAFVKQRVRWGRNSYRCYLTAIYRGWLWRQPLVTQISVFQILLTPLSMLSALSAVGLALFHQHWGLVAAGLTAMLAGRAIRSVSHLREHPEDIVYLPLVTAVVPLLALPVKTWAALTMNRHGWLTRSSNRVAGEAQSEASLLGRAIVAPGPAAAHDPPAPSVAATTAPSRGLAAPVDAVQGS